MAYLIFHNEQQKGPFEDTSIQEMIASGDYPETVLLWQDGMDDWTPANTILAIAEMNVPVPVPTMSEITPVIVACPQVRDRTMKKRVVVPYYSLAIHCMAVAFILPYCLLLYLAASPLLSPSGGGSMGGFWAMLLSMPWILLIGPVSSMVQRDLAQDLVTAIVVCGFINSAILYLISWGLVKLIITVWRKVSDR